MVVVAALAAPNKLDDTHEQYTSLIAVKMGNIELKLIPHALKKSSAA